MNPMLYLGCVFIIGSLVGTTSGQGVDDFESERERLWKIYGNTTVHEVTKIRNIPIAVDFFEKYSDQIEMTPEQRSRAADALRIYKEEQAKQGIVDNTPPQGGIWSFLGRKFLQLLIDVASNEFKKAIKTDHASQENGKTL